MSQTTNKGTTISLNGKPYIVGLPKSGRLHSFNMELVKNKNEIPWAIIATVLRFNLVRVEIRELRPEVVAESDEVLVHYRSRTSV